MAGLFTKLRKGSLNLFAHAGQLPTRLPENNHRQNKCERTHRKLENNDYLFTPIDEFREKAQQLQTLLQTKESKVKELQSIVDEKEDKAEELQQILEERQEKADGIEAEVGRHIDHLMEQVSQKMDELQTTMNRQMEDGRKLNNEQADNLRDSIEKANESENARTEQLISALSSVNEQLEGLKAELSEKIHNENVKCYRNIQDLFKGFEDQIEKIETVDQNVKSVRGFNKFLTWISVINFLTLVGFILYSVGVFNFI